MMSRTLLQLSCRKCTIDLKMLSFLSGRGVPHYHTGMKLAIGYTVVSTVPDLLPYLGEFSPTYLDVVVIAPQVAIVGNLSVVGLQKTRKEISYYIPK